MAEEKEMGVDVLSETTPRMYLCRVSIKEEKDFVNLKITNSQSKNFEKKLNLDLEIMQLNEEIFKELVKRQLA